MMCVVVGVTDMVIIPMVVYAACNDAVMYVSDIVANMHETMKMWSTVLVR